MEKRFIYQSLFIICTLGSIICDNVGTHSKHVFTYEGSGDANLSCNGSNVINITDIHLSNHPTDCPRDMCNLTVSDRNHIETCNGNSSCEIPIDELSPCIKDRGFYSVDYSCQENVFCDFEDGSYELFFEENGWNILKAQNQNNPDKDYTTGSGIGHYMYVKTGRSDKSFQSKHIIGAINQCLTFYYYIHDTDDSIVLYVKHIGGTTIGEVEIYRPDDSNLLWIRSTLSVKNVMEYYLIIEARGRKKDSKFAVDDFSIIKKDCQELRGELVYCDFEDGQCKDIVENEWTIVEAQNRYPNYDHSTGTSNGHYMSVETDGKSFHSEQIHGGINQCLTFYYNIFYASDSIMLKIQQVDGITQEEITSQNFRNVWAKKTVSIKDVWDYTLVFETRGNYADSRFAVDDIRIINKDCQERRECDFESDWCNWTSSSYWYRRQGETPSSDTGPLTDHTTTGNGYYIYMEPYHMSQNTRAYLTSPTYSGTGEMCFKFWYHMYGDQMGILRVNFKSQSNSSQLYTISGDKGRIWHSVDIDIYAIGEFGIVFEGQRGGIIRSDIAIDDVNLRSGNCKGIVQHQQECTSINGEVVLNKCSNHYLSNIHVNFDPSKDSCKDFLDKNANSICNNSSQAVLCDVRNVTRKRPSCFNLNNLVVQYKCAETTVDQTTTTTKTINESEEAATTNENEKKVTATNKPTVSETGTTHGHTGSRITNESDETGMVVGFIIGGLLVIGLICTVAFVVYRRRNGYQKGKTEKGNNNLSASWHVDGQGSYVNSVQLSTKIVPTGNVIGNNLATNNPSYEQGYIISSANNSVKKDESEYMNMPKQTAFYRTNGNTYELASPTNENSDDEYAESGVGVYDISGNSRHKVKDPIYDHSVDDTYHTSNRGRQEDLGDYTYNHVFGKKTEDDYDIAGS